MDNEVMAKAFLLNAKREGAVAALEYVASQLDKVGFFYEIDAHKMASSLRKRASEIKMGLPSKFLGDE